MVMVWYLWIFATQTENTKGIDMLLLYDIVYLLFFSIFTALYYQYIKGILSKSDKH